MQYNKLLAKILKYFEYNDTNKYMEFLKLILALRQILLLINSKTNLDVSTKLINKDLKMKAKYEYFPLGHFDICSFFYTHSTSPMRRFVDINVHNLIFNKKIQNYIYSNII